MGYTHGKRWTDAEVEERLREYGRRLGRMPTRNEIIATEGRSLANRVAAYGGFFGWAERLGLALKGGPSHRGDAWERREADFFRGFGAIVEECSHCAPFDLLVNGKRVDVKSAVICQYLGQSWRSGGGSLCRGYFFGGLKRGRECDLFDFVCHDGREALARFVVPAEAARVEAFAITRLALAGGGKYGQYRDRLDLLGIEVQP